MLTHYIIVRRDLPLGVLAAMITHAAGESGALYQDPYDGRFRHARAVVLETKNERALDRAVEYLQEEDIQHVEVWENYGPYAEQLMSVGLVPTDSPTVIEAMKDFQTLKTLHSSDWPPLDKGDEEC